MKKANIISSFIGIALSVYVFFTASTFPKAPGTIVGPDFFPMVLSVGLLVFSCILFIQALTKKENDKLDKEETKLSFKDPRFRRSFTALALTIAYAIIMPYVGFIVTSAIFLILLMLLLKNKAYLQMGLVSIFVSIAVYFLFKMVLNITLPAGFLI